MTAPDRLAATSSKLLHRGGRPHMEPDADAEDSHDAEPEPIEDDRHNDNAVERDELGLMDSQLRPARSPDSRALAPYLQQLERIGVT